MARGQSVLVSTHSALNLYSAAFHPASFLTFLRDPVERVISGYRYYVHHQKFRGTFEEFYESPEHMNVQCRMLWGIDLRDIGFIGLFKAMPDMVRALSRHLGVDLRMRHDNAAGHSIAIGAATRSRILALNDDDLRLYEYVENDIDYFTNYRGRGDKRPMPGKGQVYRTGEGSFNG